MGKYNPKNLTIDYKKILKATSISERLEMTKSKTGQNLLSVLTPTELGELFPDYFKKNSPDVSVFLAARKNDSVATSTATTYTPSSVRKIEQEIKTTNQKSNNDKQIEQEIKTTNQKSNNDKQPIVDEKVSIWAKNNTKTQSALGITQRQFDAFRKSVGKIESGNNPNQGPGGYKGHYWGMYQFGASATKTTNKILGENIDRTQFKGNQELSERHFDALAYSNHTTLMKISDIYRNLSPEKKLAVLAYAHNQGAGDSQIGNVVGAARWLKTQTEGKDGFGTGGKKYYDAVLNSLNNIKKEPTQPQQNNFYMKGSGNTIVTGAWGHDDTKKMHQGTGANFVESGDIKGIVDSIQRGNKVTLFSQSAGRTQTIIAEMKNRGMSDDQIKDVFSKNVHIAQPHNSADSQLKSLIEKGYIKPEHVVVGPTAANGSNLSSIKGVIQNNQGHLESAGYFAKQNINTETPQLQPVQQQYDIQKLPQSSAEAQEIISNIANNPDLLKKYQTKVIDEALKLEGLHEVRNRDVLKEYLSTPNNLRAKMNLDPSQTAWFAGFVNSVLEKQGIKPTDSKTPLLARSYMNWGTSVEPDKIASGDVLVKGGHVGFATGETKTVNGNVFYRMLGGNQGVDERGVPSYVNKQWVPASSYMIRRATVNDYLPETLLKIHQQSKLDQNQNQNQEQPKPKRAALLATGTNDWNDEEKAYKGIMKSVQALRNRGEEPTLVLPAKEIKGKPHAYNAAMRVAKELQLKTEMPKSFGKGDDHYHLTNEAADDIKSKYPGVRVYGDSNAVRLGAKEKETAFSGVGSSDIADRIEKLEKLNEQNSVDKKERPQQMQSGGTVGDDVQAVPLNKEVGPGKEDTALVNNKGEIEGLAKSDETIKKSPHEGDTENRVVPKTRTKAEELSDKRKEEYVNDSKENFEISQKRHDAVKGNIDNTVSNMDKIKAELAVATGYVSTDAMNRVINRTRMSKIPGDYHYDQNSANII